MTKNQINIFNKVTSSIISVTGLFVILFSGNAITGNIIGNQEKLLTSDIGVVLWGLILAITGVYLWIKEEKD